MIVSIVTTSSLKLHLNYSQFRKWWCHINTTTDKSFRECMLEGQMSTPGLIVKTAAHWQRHRSVPLWVVTILLSVTVSSKCFYFHRSTQKLHNRSILQLGDHLPRSEHGNKGTWVLHQSTMASDVLPWAVKGWVKYKDKKRSYLKLRKTFTFYSTLSTNIWEKICLTFEPIYTM